MDITTYYYYFAFFIFFASIFSIQKWFELPQPKKDKIGLIVLSIFLSSLLLFILLLTFTPTYMLGEGVAFIGMFFIFLSIIFSAFFIKWYNDKYNKKFNISMVVLVVCLVIFAGVYLVVKQQGYNERTTLVNKRQANL